MAFGAKLFLQGPFCAIPQTGFPSTSYSCTISPFLPTPTHYLILSPSYFLLPPSFLLSFPPSQSLLRPPLDHSCPVHPRSSHFFPNLSPSQYPSPSPLLSIVRHPFSPYCRATIPYLPLRLMRQRSVTEGIVNSGAVAYLYENLYNKTL